MAPTTAAAGDPASASPHEGCERVPTAGLVTPRNEKNVQYRRLRLANGLDAFLVHDPDTDKVSGERGAKQQQQQQRGRARPEPPPPSLAPSIRPFADRVASNRIATSFARLLSLSVVCARLDAWWQSAASVDVRVGYLSDPADLPGLAHFTEHMLFYSSEKYPKEDEYVTTEHTFHLSPSLLLSFDE